MSGGPVCKCKPRNIVVTQRHGNQSYFNPGPRGSWAASEYSQVRCLTCGQFWRTKADYVYQTRDATEEERTRAI